MCIPSGAGGGPGGPQPNYNPLAIGASTALASGTPAFGAPSNTGIDPTAGGVSIPGGSGGGGSTTPAAPSIPEVAREAGRSGAGRGARFSKFNRATILGGARGLGEGARVDRKSLLGA